MRFDPFISWMKHVHGKINSTIYGSVNGQTNKQHLAFLRNLEQEMSLEKSLFTPLDKLEVTVFDFETTGFFPDKGDQILSIGAVKFRNFEIKEGEEDCFYSLVRLDRGQLPSQIKQLTGLNEDSLKEAPPLSEVLVNFYQFTRGETLVAHHANHEKKFLQHANRKVFNTYLNQRIVDTSIIFQVANPEKKLVLLEEYCEFCGISGENRHHALADAKMTAELWKIHVDLLKKIECFTLHDIYDRYSKISQQNL